MNTEAPLLSVRNVTKRFGGAVALNGVSLDLRAGEVHALLGENGAGKSTLVKVIAGIIQVDEGEITGTVEQSEIAMVFQELSLIPDLSVMENLMIGAPKRGAFVNRKRGEERIRASLEAAGLGDLNTDVAVGALSLAQRQLLEIARGLISDAKILVLDEPTATLSDVEIARVHAVVRSVVAEGRCIAYITHRLGEVFELSDRITIMRSAKVVATGETSTFTMKSVVEGMLGADHTVGQVQKSAANVDKTARVLRYEGLSRAGRYSAIDLNVGAGEIVGIFGQLGSGADDIVRAAAGTSDYDSGKVTLNDTRLPPSRAGTQRLGVAYVSADRVAEGVFLDATVARNLSSGALSEVSRGGVLRKQLEWTFARDLAGRVAFNADRVRAVVGTLSGGNQQKVAIGRAIATDPQILVLDEPTRGVDIGARAEIYSTIRRLAETGVIVVVYSSDIVEIRDLCQRVVTMFRGQMVGDYQVADVLDSSLLGDILHGGADRAHTA